jgi:hypothetical protein
VAEAGKSIFLRLTDTSFQMIWPEPQPAFPPCVSPYTY